MFAYVKGRLAAKDKDFIVVEANGIGYRIHTSLSTLEALGTVGNEVKIHTHLYVREDAMSLFGFASVEELGMFELLITVSGVGPKAAISLISTVSASKFGLAVITDDAKALTKAQGIGGKTAQRIILELKDKIKKEQITAFGANMGDNTPPGQTASVSYEAASALMALGYTPLEANRAVAAVYAEGMDLEAVIKGALKGMGK